MEQMHLSGCEATGNRYRLLIISRQEEDGKKANFSPAQAKMTAKKR